MWVKLARLISAPVGEPSRQWLGRMVAFSAAGDQTGWHLASPIRRNVLSEVSMYRGDGRLRQENPKRDLLYNYNTENKRSVPQVFFLLGAKLRWDE